jgi:neutral ceramidase
MRSLSAVSLSLMVLTACLSSVTAAAENVWKAGVAKVIVTPEESMWMAGYASRNKPSEGKVHDLFAKALAIEDPAGNRVVMVTTDLIGIPRELREWLQEECVRKYELAHESLLLNASHTHCGPELRASKVSLYGAAAEQVSHTEKYYNTLKQQLLDLVGQALQKLEPSRLGYTHGRAGFAMNRRLPTESEPRNAPYPDGPVDHEVPVLKVESESGELRALLFGYACHNTTLGFYQFCGDYAGFAQHDLEQTFPGVTAMFMTGCGGDQNPQPRGELELAEHHGSSLAMAVKAGLLGPIRPIKGTLKTALEPVELEFATAPTRAELEVLQQSKVEHSQRRASALLKQLDEQGRIPTTYPYLIQVIRIGNEVLMVALSGEVVVDYSLRLKQELKGNAAVWVAGYSNDVFGYVPSLRVLEEGGYEGGGAMQFTTLPGPFAASVEARIVAKVLDLTGKTAIVSEKSTP